MFDLFKAIFGIPPTDRDKMRPGYDFPEDQRNNFFNINRNSDEEYDDDENGHIHNFHDGRRGNFNSNVRSFGFPIFSDPFGIHKYFESMMEEMNREFSSFGMGPSIAWSEKSDDFFSPPVGEDGTKTSKNLRDSFLKTPGYITDKNIKKEDVDLDGQVKASDVDQLLRKNELPREDTQITQYNPKVYAKSVFIRTVRHPDGTVETVKKIRDHTGKEETITTREEGVGPSAGPSQPNEDLQDLSIFKKFFPF